MENKRKLAFQETKIQSLINKITSLEDLVEALKSENKALEKQNKILKNLNDTYQYSSQQLNADLRNIMERCQKNLDESYDLKIKYRELINNTERMRKEYKDKMGILLQRLRKQTR